MPNQIVKEFTFTKNMTTVVKKYQDIGAGDQLSNLILRKGDAYINYTPYEVEDFFEMVNLARYPIVISGTLGLEGIGAIVQFTDGVAKAVIADNSGFYSLQVSYLWSGSVTPFKTGKTFTPSHKDYTSLDVNQEHQDYVTT